MLDGSNHVGVAKFTRHPLAPNAPIALKKAATTKVKITVELTEDEADILGWVASVDGVPPDRWLRAHVLREIKQARHYSSLALRLHKLATGCRHVSHAVLPTDPLHNT